MRRRLKYICFCICYPVKSWLRKRRAKALDDGWDEYRKAETEEWKRTIHSRMFDVDGDIYKACAAEDEYIKSLVKSEIICDGDDIIQLYR